MVELALFYLAVGVLVALTLAVCLQGRRSPSPRYPVVILLWPVFIVATHLGRYDDLLDR